MRGHATSELRTKEERDRLVEKFLPLVRHVVARLPVTMPASLDRDDFFSVGVMGLMHAAAAYDPNRGASFKTFAYTAIRGAILDEIRKHDPVPRNRRDRLRKMDRAAADLFHELGRPPTLEELSIELGVSVDDLDDDLLALQTSRLISLDDGGSTGGEDGDGGFSLASNVVAENQDDPSDRLAHRDQADALARAISELPEKERHVVVLYHYESLYLKEIGKILGVTESRVSQILTRAMTRLKLKMRVEDSDRTPQSR
jgi:RNA polymerase sigma factor for flagellar operon FliA